MRRLIYWAIAFMVVANIVACQQGNGTNSSQGTAKDSDDYYQELADKGVAYYKAYNVDSFVDCNRRLHQYLMRNEGRKDSKIIQLKAHWLKAEGVYYGALVGKTDSAIIYTGRAIRLMEQERMDPELRVITMLNKGDFYRQTGQFDLSADTYLKALAVADSFRTSEDSRIAINLGISTVYSFMGDFVNSAKWWALCKELLPKMKKPDQFIYYNR